MEVIENREHVLELLQRIDNNDLTQRLKSQFNRLQNERTPFYLTKDELYEILRWKLRGQFGRQTKVRNSNTDENVITITKAAFSVSHTDPDLETFLKLKLLTVLNGVEVPVASAILTLCFPNKYSVIDFRNWRQIYPSSVRRTTYTKKEYIEYLKIIRKRAIDFAITPQELDQAIWQFDIELEAKKTNAQ